MAGDGRRQRVVVVVNGSGGGGGGIVFQAEYFALSVIEF